MKKYILGALVALSLSAPVLAADYYVVVPMPGKVASAPESPDPVENITVTLNAFTLPAGMVNTPYSFDLNAVLDVQGDAAYDAGSVAWSVVDGATPEGIALQADGTLAGTPTVKNQAGASFEVKASYKGKDGQQVYTIVVGGQVLQVTQIAAGYLHTCAVTTSGAAKCWGYDGNGQLGNDTATTDQPMPVAVSGLESGVASISAGGAHTCAVTTSGAAKCWGYDYYGQLGNDTATTNQPTPVAVSGLSSGVESIAAGDYHTCAVTTSGAAKCWGYDTYGQLGNDTALTNQPMPVAVSGLESGVASLTAGFAHTCALTTSGAAKCWGRDAEGQLGNDTALTQQPTPVDVSGLSSGVASIAAGDYHTCAVTTSGAAKCWGYDAYGQLGDGGSNTNQSTPVDVSGLSSGVASISAGDNHTCAVTTSGAAKCWGYDGHGQLGDGGSNTNKSTPVDVSGLSSGVESISAGSYHTCAVTTSGAATCWGSDTQGQLGNDTARTQQPTPVDVAP